MFERSIEKELERWVDSAVRRTKQGKQAKLS
jgi:hypothetical protein